jgi:hypothetical protein
MGGPRAPAGLAFLDRLRNEILGEEAPMEQGVDIAGVDYPIFDITGVINYPIFDIAGFISDLNNPYNHGEDGDYIPLDEDDYSLNAQDYKKNIQWPTTTPATTTVQRRTTGVRLAWFMGVMSSAPL